MMEIRYTATLVTRDGSDSADGGPCGPGCGYAAESGWWDPTWSVGAVLSEAPTPLRYSPDDLDLDPDYVDDLLPARQDQRPDGRWVRHVFPWREYVPADYAPGGLREASALYPALWAWRELERAGIGHPDSMQQTVTALGACDITVAGSERWDEVTSPWTRGGSWEVSSPTAHIDGASDLDFWLLASMYAWMARRSVSSVVSQYRADTTEAQRICRESIMECVLGATDHLSISGGPEGRLFSFRDGRQTRDIGHAYQAVRESMRNDAQ